MATKMFNPYGEQVGSVHFGEDVVEVGSAIDLPKESSFAARNWIKSNGRAIEGYGETIAYVIEEQGEEQIYDTDGNHVCAMSELHISRGNEMPFTYLKTMIAKRKEQPVSLAIQDDSLASLRQDTYIPTTTAEDFKVSAVAKTVQQPKARIIETKIVRKFRA